MILVESFPLLPSASSLSSLHPTVVADDDLDVVVDAMMINPFLKRILMFYRKGVHI